MIESRNIDVFYGDVQVIWNVSFYVNKGEIVALIGANGAGKSTTLKSISGLLANENGAVTEGSIMYDGKRIDNRLAHDISNMGITQVFEGRRVLQYLTVEENLRAGHRGKTGNIREKIKRVYDLFPRLEGIASKASGWLSGGEQQMLVIGRALMAEPRLILLDEPSLGLAPLLVKDIFNTIKRINVENNTSILLVEQNANRALEISEYAYVMENGRIVMDGAAEEVRENPDIKEFYLGLNEFGTKKSYRDVKHYKRRKRWL